MTQAYDILIPCHYFCDLIFSGIPGMPELGAEIYTDDLTVVPGGVMNTVAALQRLGVNVGWLGTLGNDFFSRFVAEAARSEGVPLDLIDFVERPLRQVTVALSYPTDRAFVTYVDPVPDLIAMTETALATVTFRHLHFMELRTDERIPPLLEACRARGITVSMDCQHHGETLQQPAVRAVLRQLDIFLPNATEARLLTGTTDLESASACLRAFVPYLVIKDGGAGAHAWTDGGYHHAPALTVAPITDTTGAGDVFNAGFLAAYRRGLPPAECLRWGNIAGGLSLRGHGGYSTAPTLHELQAYL